MSGKFMFLLLFPTAGARCGVVYKNIDILFFKTGPLPNCDNDCRLPESLLLKIYGTCFPRIFEFLSLRSFQ